ncbi:H/ACA ribonucleoprotein complex subunit [Citrus sinensis]|uniref:H/ACA ribonucleoprotein complex subunit n=1 Tax=Citrus sinensis TaxID=2711 RepID=A0ACB8MGD3_CITSI|nr:H/ACA ribonucleoprotein complex subunit [Citrus sinensis]
MRPPRGGGGFRGGRDGGRGGRGGGRFGGGGRGGGGRGGFGFRDEGPPAEVVEVSSFLHACEGDAVTKLTNEKIPYFNAPIYLQNKTQIGKVDEIFGPINESYFSVKMMEGIVATSYSLGDKFYIDPSKLLPLARFLPQPKPLDDLAPVQRCKSFLRSLVIALTACTCPRDRHKLVQEVAVEEVALGAEEVVEVEAVVVVEEEVALGAEVDLLEVVVVVALGAEEVLLAGGDALRIIVIFGRKP